MGAAGAAKGWVHVGRCWQFALGFQGLKVRGMSPEEPVVTDQTRQAGP